MISSIDVKLILAMLAGAGVAGGQVQTPATPLPPPPSPTTVALSQLPTTGITSPMGAVYVVLPTGKVITAKIEGFVMVTHVDGSVTISPDIPAPPVIVPTPLFSTGEVLLPATAPTPTTSPTVYTLSQVPVVGTIAIYRNGIRQRAGVDYVVSGDTSQRIVFDSRYGADPAAAVVIADYQLLNYPATAPLAVKAP